VNVWADLSGLAVGDAGDFETEERQEALQDTATAVRRAFLYAERPNRFLYGSDWPLVPMAFYRDFIRATLPEAHHQQIFHDNARTLSHTKGDPGPKAPGGFHQKPPCNPPPPGHYGPTRPRDPPQHPPILNRRHFLASAALAAAAPSVAPAAD